METGAALFQHDAAREVTVQSPDGWTATVVARPVCRLVRGGRLVALVGDRAFRLDSRSGDGVQIGVECFDPATLAPVGDITVAVGPPVPLLAAARALDVLAQLPVLSAAAVEHAVAGCRDTDLTTTRARHAYERVAAVLGPRRLDELMALSPAEAVYGVDPVVVAERILEALGDDHLHLASAARTLAEPPSRAEYARAVLAAELGQARFDAVMRSVSAGLDGALQVVLEAGLWPDVRELERAVAAGLLTTTPAMAAAGVRTPDEAAATSDARRRCTPAVDAYLAGGDEVSRSDRERLRRYAAEAAVGGAADPREAAGVAAMRLALGAAPGRPVAALAAEVAERLAPRRRFGRRSREHEAALGARLAGLVAAQRPGWDARAAALARLGGAASTSAPVVGQPGVDRSRGPRAPRTL